MGVRRKTAKIRAKALRKGLKLPRHQQASRGPGERMVEGPESRDVGLPLEWHHLTYQAADGRYVRIVPGKFWRYRIIEGVEE